MRSPVATPPRPAGYAFALAELAAARDMAMRDGWGFAIRLDHGTPAEDFEEVLVLTRPGGAEWLIWRAGEGVRARGPDGRGHGFVGIAAALGRISV